MIRWKVVIMIQAIGGFNNTSGLEKLQEANKKKTSESTNLSAALTGVAETTDVTDSTAISTTKVRTTDVIEISPEGRAALAAQNAQSAESQTLAQAMESNQLTQLTESGTLEESTESETPAQSSQGTSKMAPPSPAPNEETTEDTSSTVDLSRLTEEQIDSLVEEGTITQADANVELAKRAAEDAAEKAAEKAAEDTSKEATPPPAPPKESTYDALSTNGAIAVSE